MRKILSHRWGGVVLFYFLFLAVAFVTRLALLARSWDGIDGNPLKLLGVFSVGLFFDLGAAAYGSIIVIFYLLLIPQKWLISRVHRVISAVFYFVVLYALVFSAIAEWFFWDEFGARFNFIAVDYLVYTHEVIGNIKESYPLPLIFSGIFVVSALLFFCFWKTRWLKLWSQPQPTSWRNRLLWSTTLLLVPLFYAVVITNRQVPSFGNVYNQELARNGIFSFFAAYRENEINYDQFYATLDNKKIFTHLRTLLHEPNTEFTSNDLTDITRFVRNEGEEKRYNVIQITVESLSAFFLTEFGSRLNLMPNLSNLARQGMLFTNFHATGSRTVRGMEALVLSVPPTPGQSIVKRPNNEHLFSLGSVFRSRGYDTMFIYGGFGYFDNMNYFFDQNGYKVIDRTKVKKEDITFANIWGACDGDVYNWALREADASFASGKPFHQFIMTTSNHRPFTYPDGKIDIASHTGRFGAVKYTDYAIGEFIRQAQMKPWFKDTIFVIVADHCAGSAGKTSLPIKTFEIPLIIYSPNLIKPQKVDKLCSQIDYAPTLLGLLNWSYETRFFGKDIFKMHPQDERAMVANYQKLGLMQDRHLGILEPLRVQNLYEYNRDTGDLEVDADKEPPYLEDTITYYQSASYLFTHRLYGELEPKQKQALTTEKRVPVP